MGRSYQSRDAGGSLFPTGAPTEVPPWLPG